jgi:predicted Fe-S protein YdhL (DUF1289 family)
MDFPPINLYTAPSKVYKRCQKKCKIDDSGTYCTGCGRTMEEIKKKGEKRDNG